MQTANTITSQTNKMLDKNDACKHTYAITIHYKGGQKHRTERKFADDEEAVRIAKKMFSRLVDMHGDFAKFVDVVDVTENKIVHL